jgi:DNA processing protein
MSLSLVPRVGPILGKLLIGYCGSAEAVFSEKKTILNKIPGVGKIAAEAVYNFKNFELVDRELEFMATHHIRGIHYFSDEFPLRLKQELDSPLVLFVRGETNFNHSRIVGIVGTRSATAAGLEATRNLVEELKEYKVHTISGLALGIDICAHKASIEHKIPTMGVVAHGLDQLYPFRHASHANTMIESGGSILSEHFSGTALNPDLFPRRNRIVAAMCDCLVVVESKIRGGSMITAEIASSYNRDVFALPGRPCDIMSQGCNYLIKSLKAQLCENATDIAKGMNWEIHTNKKGKKARQAELFAQLNETETHIAQLFTEGQKHYDEILANCTLPVHKLSYVLLELEMKGALRSLPGNRYELL